MKMAMNKYTDKTPLSDRFKIGNNMVCDKLQIVQEFNKYFINIGLNLNKNVPATNKHYTEFLNRPHKHSMFLYPITPVELRKITTKLKRKTKCDIPWYIYTVFPRDSFIVNISMHFWATLDMTCSGSQGDLVSPVWGGGGMRPL